MSFANKFFTVNIKLISIKLKFEGFTENKIFDENKIIMSSLTFSSKFFEMIFFGIAPKIK